MSKLNINQKKVIRRIAERIREDEGKVIQGKEYLAVYPETSPDVAYNSASRLMAKPEAQKTLAELLEEKFPRPKRTDRLIELSHATKDHVTAEGDVIEVRDNQSSLRSLELISKITGDVKEGGDVNIDARSINVTLDTDDIKRLAEIVETMKLLRSSNYLSGDVKPDVNTDIHTSTDITHNATPESR